MLVNRTNVRASSAGRAPELSWDRARLWTTRALLVLAMVGGGSIYTVATIPIELTAAVLIGILLARPLPRVRGGRVALLVIAATVALAAAQLVPLPASVWTALPGRDLARQIAVDAGVLGAHPLSLDPDATWQAALWLPVPIALFWSTLFAGARERWQLALVIAGVGIASAVLGAAQVIAGGPYFYTTAHVGQSTGVFANRNHHADLVQIATILTAALAAPFVVSPTRRLAMLAALLLFALLSVITISRMGLLLLPLSLAVATAFVTTQRRRRAWPLMLGAGALLAVGLAVISQTEVVQPIVARLEGARDDSRFDMWKGSWVGIQAYWPWGSGLGTFVPVYATVEDLDGVGRLYVNNAHNDYIETALTAGLPGIVLIVAGIAALAAAAARAIRARDRIAGAAAACILVLLLHSGVDYPLRTFTLIAVFGVLAGLLHDGPERADGDAR